ncbi:MAG: hypothetical protein A2521_08265 [Deltaproteobacteria bacterium RIFOXYD12_FULL_57_12]|nr:MAG: hypothetical protein A2521_08265 [Deltaproteobacteria bacterium RIFOXYD12_FULL_57_12]
MAEGLVNHDFAGRVATYSAGINPKGVSRLAVIVMAEIGIDISHHTSDPLQRFQGQTFDYVITLCADADTLCPQHFGGGQRLHLGFADTPHTDRPTAENLEIYRQTRDAIRDRLRIFFEAKLAAG